jgi:hypothetical protein
MTDPNAKRRVKLTRSVIMNGEHADAGSEHLVSPSLAQRLVGEGSAEHVLAAGESHAAAGTVNRMAQADNADPKTEQVAPAPPKVKGGK